ncbi:N-acetylmuramoyl-L-alanine amidase [Prosthecobacter fusiformis]|uniref:N-acetylmuramoyl-L-alanine amidase n=1 Tax=Prosthecobacter fusiformis TaxID=48464 RepID=UPI001414E5C3|nr:N-acetylmuramoyl-L-alanine amidase [Prosthecobacter fusiformis]
MKKAESISLRRWKKVRFGLRSLASYTALATSLASLAWLSNQLEAVPAVRLEPWDLDAAPLVVLDAGHGGHDGGAVAGGTIEKNLALTLTLRLRDQLLSQGMRVKMTRDKDVFLPLEERASIASQAEAAAFVSLHLNTSASPDVSGIETYYTKRKTLSAQRAMQAKWSLATGSVQDERGQWLAKSLQKHVCQATQAVDRGIKERSYAVVSQSLVPAVLIECGFLTNAPEMEKLKKRTYQEQLTRGIAAGITQFVKAHQGRPHYGIQAEAGPPTAPVEEAESASPQ